MKKLVFIIMIAVATVASAENKAVDLLKKVEGFSATTYVCPGGRPTIGYGSTKKFLVEAKKITQAKATAELKAEVAEIARKLRVEVGTKALSLHEEAAVVSFIYNVGWSAFKGSTMCRLIKEGADHKKVAEEFAKWKYVTVGGSKKISNGLVNRRAKEKRLFLTGQV